MSVETMARTHSGTSVGVRLGLLFGPSVFGVTAAGVALPEVATALGTTASVATWVLTAHALALGVGTAVFGRLTDRLGPRLTLAIGSAVLGLGAVIVLLAPNLGIVIGGRVLLAAGSGAMAAGALAFAAGQPAAERPRVVAVFGATLSAFAAAATLAGGVVTTLLTWRPTLVLPVLSLIIVPFVLRASAPSRTADRSDPAGRPRVDPVGMVLVTLAMAAWVLLVQVPRLGLPLWAAAAIGAVGLLTVTTMVWWRRRVPSGFVAAELIGARGFGRMVAIGAAVYGALFATVALVPRVLVERQGLTVLQVGLALLPGAALGAVLSRVAGRLRDQRRVAFLFVAVTAGTGLLFGGTGLLRLSGRPGLGLIIISTVAAAAFASFAITQVIATARLSAALPTTRRGAGLGLANLGFFAGGAIGSAVAAALTDVIGNDAMLGLIGLLPLTAAALASRLGR